jgi:hypothetical protein
LKQLSLNLSGLNITNDHLLNLINVNTLNISKCNNITVKNCNFSNIVYGIVSFVRGFEITNNTFSNFKSTGVYVDTATQSDIGADPIICSGSKFRITNNKITGSWAYCNPFTSSSAGLLGGAASKLTGGNVEAAASMITGLTANQFLVLLLKKF